MTRINRTLFVVGIMTLPGFTYADVSDTAYGNSALPGVTSGQRNSVFGYDAGTAITTMSDNSLFGAGAGFIASGASLVAVGSFSGYHVTGTENTALGYSSMSSDLELPGNYQTAVGSYALFQSTGSENTGVGYETLFQNQASGLTAVGARALYSNTTGGYNTAIGQYAANQTGTGSDNVAIGAEALRYNTTGSQNMALGRSALRNSTSAGFNSVIGYASCWSCKSASQNVAVGPKTLYSLASGNSNVAIGYTAGYNLTGSNNVAIANAGMSADNGVIRIGAPSTQTKAFIAGIATSHLTGAPVYVTSDGQLGVAPSSRRYKEDIQNLSDAAPQLARLRPVSFHLKSEPQGPLQYGLIAEEVAAVYPELVIRDNDGAVQGVRYDELAPMLLKQVQVLQADRAHDRARLQAQAEQLAQLTDRLQRLERAERR